RRQVAAVAADADAVPRAASQHRADDHRLDAGPLDLVGDLLVDHLVLFEDDLASLRVHDALGRDAPDDAVTQRLDDLFRFAGRLLDGRHPDAFGCAAVFLPHDDVLGDVHEAAGQVTRVRRPDGRVRQALAGAVRGDEVLQHREALAEVGLDRNLDGPARRVGHQAAHAGHLGELRDVAASARLGHHPHRIELVQVRLHRLGDRVLGLGPDLDDLLVPLLGGDEAAAVLALDELHFLLSLGDELV